MYSINKRVLFAFIVFAVFLSPLCAEDKRVIPVDMYLIIDGSSTLENSKNDVIAWINDRIVDRILMDGDSITIWNAGDNLELFYSATLSGDAGKKDIKDKLQTLTISGNSSDFSGALREASARVSRTPATRLAVTMLIAATAENLEPAFTGSSQDLFRWFRSEKYVRWQVLMLGPDIGSKVRQYATAYMNSRR